MGSTGELDGNREGTTYHPGLNPDLGARPEQMAPDGVGSLADEHLSNLAKYTEETKYKSSPGDYQRDD